VNVLSLFSGIGGLDLGLERAGMTVAGQVEIDPWCRTILAKHWPEVPRHDDVRTAAEWWGDRPRPDLICGGFPCQPVSVAGLKLAQDDERWLWPAMAACIGALRPRFALMENVPGLLARGMGDVLGALAALGYDAEWDCVPASAVGAPHQRDRVWIVANSAELLGDGGDGEPGRQVPEPGDRRRAAAAVADAEGQCRELRQAAGERPGRLAGSGAEVPDADGQCRRTFRPVSATQARPVDSPGRRRQLAGVNPWPAEPDVGRVAHGIPRRVDRLRGLGNAVVPQVAEHIGRLILAADLAVSP